MEEKRYMKKKTVHRLAAFMTACFLAAGDLGNSGYVMVSGEAMASEKVSLQEEQAEGQAESTPVAGSGGTEEISGTEIPQITPAQGNAAENAPAAPTGQEEKQEQPASQEQQSGQEQSAETENKTDIQAETKTEQSEGLEQEADQEQAEDQKQSADQEQNKDQTAAPDEAVQENEEQAAPEGQDQAPSSETAVSGIKKQIQEQGFAYVETQEDHVPVYTAADGNGEKKGEILKKDSLLLGEQYVENQDAQDWVKVWFDTDTEEGKLSGFVTAESLKKDPVENQAALQRIQNSGLAVDAWQDPGMTRPLAEVAYQPVEAPVEEPADEIIEDSSADEILTDETPVDETATSADKKSAEGEAEETNRKDITFRIHWDESAMPEVGDRYRPDRVSVYLYRENVYRSTVAYIYKRDNADQDQWETVFKSVPVYDPTGNEYEYNLRFRVSDSTEVYKYSDIKQSGEQSELYEADAILQKTATIHAEIRWNDYDDLSGIRPTMLTADMITLVNTRRTSEIFHPSSVEKQENGNYTAIFEDIPTMETGYRIASSYITNVNLPVGYNVSSTWLDHGKYLATCNLKTIYANAKVSITQSINKSWDYNYDGTVRSFLEQQGVTVLDSVIVTLTNHGQTVDVKNASQTVSCGVNTPDNKYQTVSWHLPVYDKMGQEIDYSDLNLDYQLCSEKGEVSKGYRVKCLKTDNLRYELRIQYAGFMWNRVRVTWEDNEDLHGLRPNNIELQILANGKPVELSKILTLRKNQKEGYIRGYFPAYDEKGIPIEYSMKINGLPDYYETVSTQSPAFDANSGYEFDLANSNYLESAFTC